MTTDTQTIDAPNAGASEQAPQTNAQPAPESGTDAPATERDATAAPAGAEGNPSAPKAEDAHKPKSGLQKRIDELTWQAREAQRQLADERIQRLQMEARQKAVQDIQAIDQKEPRVEGYDTVSEFAAAHARWASERTVALINAQQSIQHTENLARGAEEQQRQAAAQARQAEQAALINERLAKGAEKYKDFTESLMNPALPSAIGSPLFDAVMAADNSVDIAYSLSKNPAEYERLLALSFRNPAMAFKEVLKLDHGFSGASTTSAAPPPPPNPGSRSPIAKSPDQMTDKEWMEWREADIRKRKKAS